jgi:predicted Ser/Thr protein kinase
VGDRATAIAWPFRKVGDVVGRYRLVERIGRGGMGVVYRAFDPELDREVALKLLRPDLMKSVEERTRLVREAQAMAQLAHPNVVAVYDVGVADSVWIAMELVRGVTLRDWVAAGARGTQAIVDALAQAGRGLAAAHAVGIVHRDFKPSNVMVGDDGRVRVMDFGLASASTPTMGTPDAADSSGSSRVAFDRSGSLEQSLTASGIVVGTPAYMAPEQHTGDPVDARADQYALAIALWESLCGRRPFGGESIETLIDAKLVGVERAPADVPKHVGRALARALAPDPSARFADTAAFVAAFATPPRRRGLGAAVIAVGVVGFAASAWLLDGARGRSCPAHERAGTIWGARRDALETVAGSEAVRRIDERVSALIHVHEEGCRSANADDVAPGLLEARQRCIDARWAELDVVADAWSRPPSPTPLTIDAVLNGLASPTACIDAVRPALVVPSDPAKLERIRAIHVRLAEANAIAALGRPDQALEEIAELPAAAEALGDVETNAFVERMLGTLNGQMGRPDRAEPRLVRAFELASEAGLDDLATDLAIELVRVVGVDLGRRDDADTWVRHARRSSIARATAGRSAGSRTSAGSSSRSRTGPSKRGHITSARWRC